MKNFLKRNRYNTENATIEEIQDAAEQANALQFILKNQFGSESTINIF